MKFKTNLVIMETKTPYRASKCICGCEEMVISRAICAALPDSPRGKWAHIKCARKMWTNGSIENNSQYNDNWESTHSKNHRVEVIDVRANSLYYIYKGFTVEPYSPSHRKYVLPMEKNAKRTGIC